MRICSSPRSSFLRGLAVLTLLGAFSWGRPAIAADSASLKTLTPGELVKILNAQSPKPLLFQVGSHMLYMQAHIPNSEYMGQGNTPEGLQRLGRRVGNLPKKTFIVLYCGCCPWNHCPNVNPAYDALTQLSFTNVKVLYIANNFGADWVSKGYPIARGE